MRNQLLKKTVLAFAALFAFAVTSVAQNAQLLSFGFYKADNAGLSQDYEATIPAVAAGATSYEVEIGLPASADLTELVARFTVNEGNTVTVDGVAQTSGVTKNDFTDPIDYLVRGSNNVRYTITVVEATTGESGWKELAVLDATQLSGNEAFTGVYSGAVLAISPKDNAPYVAYGARGVDNKMSVAKFENGAWAQVGTAMFSAVANGSHYDFDIAPDGTPYVAYGDQDAASLKGALSVMKFDGSQWSYVGDQGFFKVQAQYPGLAATKDGLAIDLINNSKDGDIARRAMGVATYNGTWTTGESSLLASGQGVYMTKMGGNGKIATLISVNRGAVDGVNYGHNIFKYENGEWESLATNFLETGATQTSIAPGSFGTTVALDGTIYAWTGDDAPNTDKVYQVRLKKYNAETKTWSTVAGNTLPIGHDGGFESHLSLDVAIAPNGTPYVAYNNFKDQKKLYVMYLDPSTNQWSAAQQLAEGADDVNIKFDKAGNGYITYTDANNKIHLLTTVKEWKEQAVLDATQLAGNEAFTGVYSGAVLAISPKDNAPYVAYGARGVDNKMSVAKFENGAWAQVGTAMFSAVANGSHYDFDIAPDGTPYVAYGDQDAASLKGALSVMKFDGSQWSYVGDQGFFKVQAQYPGLAATKDGLAIDLINNSKDGDIARRAMGVATYNGTWTTGESSLLASGQGVYMTKMGGNGKIATLISVNRGAVDGVNYGHNIFKYENGEWESLATNFLETGATQTSIAPGSFGTTVALDGTIYAWTGDDAPNTDKVYQVRLKKYNAETKTWSTVAGNTLPIGHDGGFESHLSLDVAIAPNGTPYVAYNNFKDQKKLYVMYLDPSTNQWSAAQQLAEDADDVNIKFDKVGTCYITYTDGNNKIHLLKYGAVGAGGAVEEDEDDNTEKPAITFEAAAVERTITIGLNAAGTVKVDWGDGNLVEGTAAAAYDGWDNGINMTGTPAGTVKIYGDNINYLEANGKFNEDKSDIPNAMTAIDVTNAKELTELLLNVNKLNKIDISKNDKLQKLNIANNKFEAIDLSAQAELTTLTANDNLLTTIDLSKNTKLTTVVLTNNQLTTLDFTNNPLVKTFTVLNNQLTDVIIGANTNKNHTFQFGGNKLTTFSLADVANLSGSFVYLRDNDLTSIVLPAAVKRLWVDGNAFNLAQLYELKAQATQTFTYATTFTKEQAQQPYAIDATSTTGTVDLSALAKLGETATVFTWKKADGTALVEGTDYTVTDGKFSFLKPVDAIHCEMTNAELDAFTAEKPYTTTVTTIAVADGISTLATEKTPAVWFNLAGQKVTSPKNGVYVKDGKAVFVK